MTSRPLRLSDIFSKVGNLVGYQVGLDKMTSEDTRLTYVTTGVLLRHIIQAKHLNRYTHIILDEVWLLLLQCQRNCEAALQEPL